MQGIEMTAAREKKKRDVVEVDVTREPRPCREGSRKGRTRKEDTQGWVSRERERERVDTMKRGLVMSERDR